MAEAAAQSVGELPVKRPRAEEEENGGVSVEMEVNNGAVTELPECMSSVIPGWFSEMSPMWPGDFLFTHCVFSSISFFATVFLCFDFRNACIVLHFHLNLVQNLLCA